MLLQTPITMVYSLASMLAVVNAVSVVGKPEGFGSQATGGVKGPTVTPQNNAELINYLKQSGPLTIVVSKTFDFRGTEGTVTETGCAPYGTGASCQLAINAGNWCKTEQPDAPPPKSPTTKQARTLSKLPAIKASSAWAETG